MHLSDLRQLAKEYYLTFPPILDRVVVVFVGKRWINMESIVWATAIVVIALLFFLLFRKPISTLIERITSVSKNGIHSSPPQIPQKVGKEKTVEEVLRAFDSEVLREQQGLITKDLEARGLHDQDEIIRILTKHLAATQLELRFEIIDKLMLGSQIRLLQCLNPQYGVPIDNLKSFYDEASRRHPEFYEKLAFHDYMGFLSDGLMLEKDDLYYITEFGRDFLVYFAKTGKPLSRFG